MPFLRCLESSSPLSWVNGYASVVNELQSKSLLAFPAVSAGDSEPLVVIFAGHTGSCLELE